ncbi:MAG: thioredoxin family protein [Thermoguttaceae bacterium]|nr:thioredoxin family protein [Thermoguttaceae bacterium]
MSQSLAEQVAEVPEIARAFQEAVRLKLPSDTKLPSDAGEVELIRHPSFSGLGGKPGLAIIDFSTSDPALYGCVVWTLPAPASDRFDLAEIGRALGAAPPQLRWMTDYVEAVRTATQQEKMLLVFFCNPGHCALSSRFEAETLSDPEVRAKMTDMVRARVTTDAKAALDGGEVVVLNHPAFAEMLGQPGLAILDFAHKDPRLYGHVVSVFPFVGNEVYTKDQMKVILGLPPGTLTQRTLIYAVRTHPERPASANGQVDPNLLAEAESHSEHQARIGVQGHHGWESRFHRINARLPAGCLAYEVCAESWPGQGLLQAAIECVRCWRMSSGHWRSVASPSQAYGYDMKRGANGIWYATGIVGR